MNTKILETLLSGSRSFLFLYEIAGNILLEWTLHSEFLLQLLGW